MATARTILDLFVRMFVRPSVHPSIHPPIIHSFIHSFIHCIGSAGRREEESPEEAYYWNTNIAPIVDEMATHIKGTFLCP